ncbi:MAG TPA: PadR family transcriptional regulator [Actinomycetes bacterium]
MKYQESTEPSTQGRRGHHHHGPGPGFGPGFGPGSGRRGPWGPPRGRRRERGDVKAAVLLLLAESPRHGYEILTELADRSDGQWQPSPGSIYPVLKRLAMAGLVTATQEDGKRIFALTDEGRALVATEGESWGTPWAQSDPSEDATTELWSAANQLGAAVWQVGQLSDKAQIAATVAILADARKEIYGLLAG